MRRESMVWSLKAARALRVVLAGLVLSVAVCAEEPASLSGPVGFEAKVRVKLDQPGDWDFVDTPLRDVADFFSHGLEADVLLDRQALADVGIDAAAPVTFSVRGITARSALRLILEPLELTYLQRDEALQITTQEAAERNLVVRVYPVGNLIAPAVGDEMAVDYDSVISAITHAIAGDSWEDVGGPGAIALAYGALVVSQTVEVHEQIERFVNACEQMPEPQAAAANSSATCLYLESDGNARIRAALPTPVDGDFLETPLRDAVVALAEAAHIPILLDHVALEDQGVALDAPVTARFAQISLRHALRRVLRDLQLTYVVRDEVLQITTSEAAAEHQVLVLYPVVDLVGDGSHSLDNADFDTLVQTIASTVRSDTWENVGGPGTISSLAFAKLGLAIRQTEDGHEEIGELLTRLRWAKQAESKRNKVVIAPQSQRQIRVYTLSEAWSTAVDPLLKLIDRELGRETWTAESGVYVEPAGNLLVVKHNQQVHRRLAAYLQKIGASPNIAGGQFQGMPAGGEYVRPPHPGVEPGGGMGGANGGGGFF